MTPLTPVDQLFLWLEKRQQPMHVGGLSLFSFPEGAGPKYITEMAESLRAYQHPEPPFNKRLVRKFGQYFWELDDHFDLEHHFRHEALPKPGRIRELLARVSAEHSNQMDRERPLWEAHLIEGVRGKRFALYFKAHHSMIDGISAMRMTARAFSEDPAEMDLPPIWAMRPQKTSDRALPSPSDVFSGLSGLLSGAGKQLSTIPTVAREISKSIQQARNDPDYVSVFQAPQSILNQHITGSRRFAAQSYPMERIKVLCKKFDATVNDIVLAICGSALRDYLISQHALPDQPLIAMVPVSHPPGQQRRRQPDCHDSGQPGHPYCRSLQSPGSHQTLGANRQEPFSGDDPGGNPELYRPDHGTHRTQYADRPGTQVAGV